MVNAGASIDAFLKLDATDFHRGLTDASESVTKFKNAMVDVGKSSNDFVTGANQVSRALQNLIKEMDILSTIDNATVTKFKTVALALENIATAAQRLSTDAQRGSVGIEALSTIMQVFESGMASAEITIKATASALREFSANSSTELERLNVTVDSLKENLLELGRGVLSFNRIDAESNKVKQSVALMDSEFERAKNDLLEIGQGVSAFNRIDATSNKVKQSLALMNSEFERAKNDLLELGRGVLSFNRISEVSNKVKAQMASMNAEFKKSMDFLLEFSWKGVEAFNKIDAESNKLKTQIASLDEQFKESEAFLEHMAWTGVEAFNKIDAESNKVKESLARTKAELKDFYTRMSQVSRSMSEATTQTKSFGKALGTLRTMGTLVGSMMVYNFVHNLISATRETVNAKSEMEGYFQMLKFTSSEVKDFNSALDDTIKKFPRLNKYSLGETISSVGVEFNLTTEEMKKAMPVVSMITSEYLRAGRNANEASLAVKDILQGEFQRLSRETGVKQDTLKEAGWSGDKNDVMGLLDALDKVGKSRNWDVFVTKANSLNDAVLIMQNRFGEWSADMVNVVQPTILGVFNTLMSGAESFGTIMGDVWKWLNNGSWEAIATQIGLVGIALSTVSQVLVMYRGQIGLVQASQLGLKKSLATVVFGLKGEELAHVGVRNAIMAKILGVKAETLAENGLSGAISRKIVSLRTESTQQIINTAREKLATLVTKDNTLAKELNTLKQDLNLASKRGLISATEAETIAEKINTAEKELNTIATIEQEGANTGLIGSLYLLGTGEAIVTGETGALAIAMGVLNGVIALSPIGWFIGMIMALAGAFYVATGGLSDHWEKMKDFNEMMDNSKETIKENKKYLKDLGETLGTDSKIYQDTATVVDAFNEKLKESKKTVKKYKEEVKNIDIKLTTSFEENLKEDYGFSDDKVAKFREYGVLDEGQDTYNRALDVIYKQESDAEKTQKNILDKMDKRGASDEEIADKSNQIKEHETNLIKHSAEHNTSEDWWGGTWAGLLAGVDSVQLWLDHSTEDMATWVHDFESQWSTLPDQLNEALANIDWGIDFSAITKWIYEDVPKSLGDSWKSLQEMWDNNIAKPVGEFFANVMSDPLGAFGIDLGNIDIIGSLLNAVLPTAVSAEDGSDHLPVQEEMYQVLIKPIVDTINNFCNDPIGTLSAFGIQLPQLDLMGFISSILPTGGMDIMSWLSSTFDISGIISYFTTNLSGIVSSVSSTVSMVGSLFGQMKNAIWGTLTTIASNVTNGFNTVRDTAVSKINAMKDGVKGAIDSVIGAFAHMKDSILGAAKAIWDGVNSKFKSVSDTIGGFYDKLTHPDKWFSGGGPKSYSKTPKPHNARKLFGSPSRSTGRHHGAGINPYTQPSKQITLDELVKQIGGDKKVNISEFLSLFANSGFGGWDFSKVHKDTIYSKSQKWNADSPSMNGITMGNGFPVLRFWEGKAQGFTWNEFMAVAEAIFTNIPYKFYMDSDWKGNWVNALLSGAMNCSDGADALIALADLFGFSHDKIHMNLKDGTGHFYALINGHKMDTTNFQNSGSWHPLSGGGSPRHIGGSPQGKTINVTVDMSNATVYGVEDLDNRIADGVEKGLQKAVNDPYTVAI